MIYVAVLQEVVAESLPRRKCSSALPSNWKLMAAATAATKTISLATTFCLKWMIKLLCRGGTGPSLIRIWNFVHIKIVCRRGTVPPPTPHNTTYSSILWPPGSFVLDREMILLDFKTVPHDLKVQIHPWNLQGFFLQFSTSHVRNWFMILDDSKTPVLYLD